MAIRNNETQRLHDSVIRTATDNLVGTGNFRVYSNPGSAHNTRVGDLYPDIILTPLDNNSVQFIIEVETSDSVNANEALRQWRSFSNLGGLFYLLVPQSSRILAENICKQCNIKARFGTYYLDTYQRLVINYE